ncbi:MAG: dTDP-4-dehydrorhamnose reductase [Nitrospirota bacterium]
MMKVLLLGARGQLATALRPPLEAAGHIVSGLTHEECDITDGRQTARHLEAHRPDVVINTTAYHQVDQCETEIERAFLVNGYGPRDLAGQCESRRIRLVHVSTNYVFDGRQRTPYDEEAAPNPLSVYALSKLAGELFVRGAGPRHLVVRTAGVYGRHGGRRAGDNFVERMIAAASGGRPLRVVNDQVMTPTYAGHLAAGLVKLLDAEGGGLYHLTNRGSCSWWEFARAVIARAGLGAEIEPVSTNAYGAAAPRPAYSVLSSRRLNQAGLSPMPPWEEGLEVYFRDRLRGLKAGTDA